MSDERRKFILLKSSDEGTEHIVEIFNGEVVEAGETSDFILAESFEQVNEDHLLKPIILTSEPKNYTHFLKGNGEIALDTDLLENEIIKTLVSNYAKKKKGIYQNYILSNFLEYQNTFKVIDFSRLGFYADIIHLEAHENDFHPVKIRTFLDLTLLFFNYLTQEMKGSFPVEIDLGRNDEDFVLSINLRNQGIEKESFFKMFHPIDNNTSEKNLLTLMTSSCDLLDIEVDRNTIKITGFWNKAFDKKHNSIIFLFDLDRSEYQKEEENNSYNPELLYYDKEKHYGRLRKIKEKDLPYDESETLNYNNLKVSGKILEELALFTKKTLKPQFLRDLTVDSLKHVLEGFPDQKKVVNLSDEDCEKIIFLLKELSKPGQLLQKKNGLLDDKNFLEFFSQTNEEDFLTRVKGFLEEEEPYLVAKETLESNVDKLVGEISAEHLEEEIVRVKGKANDLEDTIMRVFNFNSDEEGKDHWLVKGLSQYLSREDFPETELEQKVFSFLEKVQKASESKNINDMKPKLKELSEDWHVKSLGDVKEEISEVVSLQVKEAKDPGDEAIEALSDLLLSEEDQLGGEDVLLKTANEKLNKEKDFYKRTNENDKKRIVQLREEIEKLKETIRLKDHALRKEKEFQELEIDSKQTEKVDESRFQEFNKEAKNKDNFGDQKKIQQLLAKAMKLNEDLLKAEKMIKQMEADNRRQQSFYNKELDKALRKSQAAQNIADKAKSGLIRVANTNQNEIKSLKRSLDRVQNELMTSNGQNMTRIKDLEKQNYTLNANNNNIKSKFEIVQSKYEKILKEKETNASADKQVDPGKVRAMELKLQKVQDQLKQSLTLGKGLQGKIKNYEFHEQQTMQKLKEYERSISNMKKNEQKLLAATGKKINPQTGEVEGTSTTGKGVIENRDKLIAANNKVLDLKKRLHAVERDRDNFMRKLKALEKQGGSKNHGSPVDSVSRQQHERLEESFKQRGEDFKKTTIQLENSRQEVNQLKTKARALEAEKQQLVQEIEKLKKRNAA